MAATGMFEDRYWEVYAHRSSHVRSPPELASGSWSAAAGAPSGPWARHIGTALHGARRLLDVGAGDRRWAELLPRLGVQARYLSCDPDRRHDHDHDDFLAVAEPFDAILMLDLLEHLPAQQGIAFVDHAAELLPPGGALVISTPNPAHPTSFQASDFTHIRPWPAHDLFGLCRSAGFSDVRVHRIQHVDGRLRRALVPVQRTLSRLIGVDPADHLLLVAIL